MTCFFHFSLTFGDSSQRPTLRTDEFREAERHHSNNYRKLLMKSPEMYKNTLLYVFSRVLLTIASVFISLWLNGLTGAKFVATVPLFLYFMSFLTSLPMYKLIRWFGHHFMYFLGIAIFLVGCVLVEISAKVEPSNVLFFGIAACFGIGSSVTIICSLCLIADMIEKKTEQSGFVYSTVTTADKLISGILIIIIQLK